MTERSSPRSHSAFAYLLLFGLAITVPLLLLLGGLMLESASAHRSQVESRMTQVLNALVSDLDRDLDRDVAIFTLATSDSIKKQDWRRFYDQARAALQGRAYLVLIDADGRQLVNTYLPYGKQPRVTGDPDSLDRILQSKAPVVSNLFVSLAVKKPVFNVSVPILEDGRVRYVLSLGLLPTDLLTLLQSEKLAPDWITTITDANGTILARSKEHMRFVGRRIGGNRQQRGFRSAFKAVNLEGVTVLATRARSPVSGWSVGLNTPYALVEREVRTSVLIWSAAALFAVAISLALGLYFARRITTPLAVAAEAAAAYGRGEPFTIAGSRLTEANGFLSALRQAQQARDQHQWRAEVLAREVQHRAKNLITVIQSLAGRMLPRDSGKAFRRMLESIARNLDIFSSGKTVTLRSIIEGELASFRDQIEIAGCDLLITAEAGQDFGLIIHELTTNALKYGALSSPSGKIVITGRELADGEYAFRWEERDGPTVRQPIKPGFGHTLLQRLASGLASDVRLDFAPEGFSYELRGRRDRLAQVIDLAAAAS